jgi:hypothetical protein
MWEANKRTQDWHKENLPEVWDKGLPTHLAVNIWTILCWRL